MVERRGMARPMPLAESLEHVPLRVGEDDLVRIAVDDDNPVVRTRRDAVPVHDAEMIPRVDQRAVRAEDEDRGISRLRGRHCPHCRP